MASFADYFDCGCCNPYKIAKRLFRLFLSLWMICDMISDALTNKKYYDIAQVSKTIAGVMIQFNFFSPY